MSQPKVPPTPRQRFLAERQRRQSVIFSTTAGVMVVCALVAFLVFTGVVKIPFGNGFNAATKWAKAGSVPCPTEGATALDPATVTVQVLNGSSTQGIAGEATQMLQEVGFSTLDPGNAASEYAGSVEVDAGPLAVDAAWTVQRYFPKAKVVLTESTERTVTVILGRFYEGRMSAEEVEKVKTSTAALNGGNCVALNPDTVEELEEKHPEGEESGTQSDAQSGQS